jgi:predicted NAD/FAD-dependent oxidoreductase
VGKVRTGDLKCNGQIVSDDGDCPADVGVYIAGVKKSESVAVIGAGLGGLSCAQVLRAAGVSVRVFEQNGAVGGRCATQLWQGHLVDTGVQFFTAQTGDFKKELLTRLRQFRPIIAPVLDQYQEVLPNTFGPRFYVLQGNNYFAHVLSQGLDLRLNCEIEPLKFQPDGVKIEGETFRAVVSSLPGPQTARLLGLGESPADYESSIVGLLEYAGTDLGRSREAYARLLGDSREPLKASYCENNKVGRIVGNKTVFVVEATPAFSREHLGAPSENYLPALVKAHEEAWEIPAGRLTAAFGVTWKLSRPAPGVRREVTLPAGAFLCGDSRTDPLVEDVWLNGQKTGRDVLYYLSQTA